MELLKEREVGDKEKQSATRRAVFVAQITDRRPSNYGFPLIRRYVVAAFAYGRDRVAYTRTTSNAVELPETVTKTEDGQQAAYKEIKTEIERRLMSLDIHVPVHRGFLRPPADNGLER